MKSSFWSGIWDEIILLERDTGCLEIDDGREVYKNHLMSEKTPNNDHLHISGLPVTYNP